MNVVWSFAVNIIFILQYNSLRNISFLGLVDNLYFSLVLYVLVNLCLYNCAQI